jgi:hypothetical protein
MFTKTQFELYIQVLTNNPSYTVTPAQLGLFFYFIDLYEEQLLSISADDYPIFNFTDKIITKVYDIKVCSLYLLPTPLWLSYQVEKYNLKTKAITPLVEYDHYTTDTKSFNSNEYLYSLNFNCLTCNCECEKIRITGVFGIKIPDRVLHLIMNIVYNNITTGSTVGSSDCCANIKSKSDGAGFSVTYYDKPLTQLQTGTTKQADNILSYPIIARMVYNYQSRFLHL